MTAIVGMRERRCDADAARIRFIVVSVSLVIAALILTRVLSSVVGYAMLCLALVGSQLVNLLREEHAHRRRVASLIPRPAADAVPTVWVAIAVASVMMLAPYVILGEERVAALLVGLCAIAMAGIAWRIASGPVQLHGDNIRYERMHDRALRSRKAGLSAVIAIGAIYAFICFVNVGLSAVLPLQRLLVPVAFVTWAGLAAWVWLYSHHLDRLSKSAA
ncbi:MAG: hypothetical protein ABR975_03945 [Vulcanimicrobiaceae bacterium]